MYITFSHKSYLIRAVKIWIVWEWLKCFLLFPRCFQGNMIKFVSYLTNVQAGINEIFSKLSLYTLVNLSVHLVSLLGIHIYCISLETVVFFQQYRALIAPLVEYRTWKQEVAGLIPGLVNFFLKNDDSHCDRMHSCLSAAHYFEDGYEAKQLLACKEYW